MMRIERVEYHSETTLSIYFGDVEDSALVVEIARFAEFARDGLRGVVEVVACAASLFLEFDVLKSSVGDVEKGVYGLLDDFVMGGEVLGNDRVLELPVFYDSEVAPDLLMLADHKGLSVDEVVELHSEVVYSVASLGFAPGFAYLSGLNPRLAISRMSAPKRVAKGSVGIADVQTAVYPRESPGGWVIVGNCPVSLFDVDADPITPFVVGGGVKFRSICRDEFIELGGVV